MSVQRIRLLNDRERIDEVSVGRRIERHPAMRNRKIPQSSSEVRRSFIARAFNGVRATKLFWKNSDDTSRRHGCHPTKNLLQHQLEGRINF